MTLQDLLNREQARLGVEMGPTRWREVLQADIDSFGRCTYDPDPMHIDPAWAKAHSPFKGTIAFGFWTLSMLSNLLYELARTGPEPMPAPEGMIGINYGCDRLRFIEPVPVGSRIRARGTLVSIEQPEPDRLRRVTDVTVEIEGKQKPALTARWLSISLLPQSASSLTGFRTKP
jgi:acyl dehydratase